MVVNKEFILAAFYDACQTLGQEDAIAQVAAQTGQEPETVQSVIAEEVAA